MDDYDEAYRIKSNSKAASSIQTNRLCGRLSFRWLAKNATNYNCFLCVCEICFRCWLSKIEKNKLFENPTYSTVCNFLEFVTNCG